MMTKIKITNVPGYCHIRIEGHAGYGFANLLPEGNDIVCAAISVLGQTAAQCIMDMSDAGKVGIKAVSYTHLDVYKRQGLSVKNLPVKSRQR